MKRCYNHPDQAIFAWCDHCGRPCCDACVVEILNDWVCERCKQRVVQEVTDQRAQADAHRAALIAAAGTVFGGVLLGPWALLRAHRAQSALQRTPWLRGVHHVRAARLLGGLALAQGVVWAIGLWLQHR